MPDLVATVGAAGANTFATQDEADVYADARLNVTAWTDASDDDKARALIEATRDLSVLEWDGGRTDTTQALSWPRTYATNPDLPSLLGLTAAAATYFDDDVIPQRIKDATCELAIQYLKAGTSDLASSDGALPLTSLTVGPISLDFAAAAERAQGLTRFTRVLSLIAPLLSRVTAGFNDVVRA